MEQNEKEMVDEKILIAKLDKEVELDKKQNQKGTTTTTTESSAVV